MLGLGSNGAAVLYLGLSGSNCFHCQVFLEYPEQVWMYVDLNCSLLLNYYFFLHSLQLFLLLVLFIIIIYIFFFITYSGILCTIVKRL